jgi:hypothetical protein
MQKFKPSLYISDYFSSKEDRSVPSPTGGKFKAGMQSNELSFDGFPGKKGSHASNRVIRKEEARGPDGDLKIRNFFQKQNRKVSPVSKTNVHIREKSVEKPQLFRQMPSSPFKSVFQKPETNPKAKAPIRDPVEDANLTFSPLLNKKSLIMASKLKSKIRSDPQNLLLDQSEIHFSNYSLLSERPTNLEMAPSKISQIQFGVQNPGFIDGEHQVQASKHSDPGRLPEPFRPKINKYSEYLDQRKQGGSGKPREDLLFQDYEQRLRKLREKKNEYLDAKDIERFEQCSFRPQTNNTSFVKNDQRVEERLLNWDKVREVKVEKLRQMLSEVDPSPFTPKSKPEDCHEDLSFMNPPSVSRSISKFLHRQELVRRLKDQKDALSKRFVSLRPDV